MSTDRELLELAAKAAGIKHVGPGLGGVCLLIPDPKGREYPTGWNPLDDDGDALRLATELGIGFNWSKVRGQAYVHTAHVFVEFGSKGQPSRQEATRRAIVRAAAEIGRSMP